MQEVVTAPLMFFLSSILLGIGLLGIYDILRAFRAVIQHGLFFTAVEDILYFMFVAVISFWFLCTYNHGELRGFFFIGIFIGIFLFYITQSHFRSWNNGHIESVDIFGYKNDGYGHAKTAV